MEFGVDPMVFSQLDEFTAICTRVSQVAVVGDVCLYIDLRTFANRCEIIKCETLKSKFHTQLQAFYSRPIGSLTIQLNKVALVLSIACTG